MVYPHFGDAVRYNGAIAEVAGTRPIDPFRDAPQRLPILQISKPAIEGRRLKDALHHGLMK